jgi:hypothetical protein
MAAIVMAVIFEVGSGVRHVEDRKQVYFTVNGWSKVQR